MAKAWHQRTHRLLKRVISSKQPKLTRKRPQHHERDALARAGDAEHNLSKRRQLQPGACGERNKSWFEMSAHGAMRLVRSMRAAHRGAQSKEGRNPHADGAVVLLLLRLRVRQGKCRRSVRGLDRKVRVLGRSEGGRKGGACSLQKAEGFGRSGVG